MVSYRTTESRYRVGTGIDSMDGHVGLEQADQEERGRGKGGEEVNRGRDS